MQNTKLSFQLASTIVVTSVFCQWLNYYLSNHGCRTELQQCTTLNLSSNQPKGLFFNGNREMLQIPGFSSSQFSSENSFQPDGCVLSKYSTNTAQNCLQALNVKKINVGGTGRLVALATDEVDQSLHQSIKHVLVGEVATSLIYDTITIGTDRSFVAFWSDNLKNDIFRKLFSSANTSKVAFSVSPGGLKYTSAESSNNAASLAFRSIVINRVCNNVVTPQPYDATCFVAFSSWKDLKLVQGLMLAVCVAIVSCYLCVRFRGKTGSHCVDVCYNESICCYVVLAVFIFVLVNTGLFGSATKRWNFTAWVVCSLLVIVVAVYGVKPAKDQSVLNRDQTSEWYGWMQLSFLMYHYLGAGRVPIPLYIWIRMMVGGFMFMTGFGHTSYFLTKSNYSIRRVWQILSRLNCLQMMLCCLLYKPWIFYYFPPLATVWFVCIYLTLFISFRRNNRVAFVSFKIFMLVLSIEFMLSSTGSFIFRSLFLNPLTKPLFELGHDNGKFWYSRFSMDRYAVPAGMMFAVLLKKVRSLDVQFIGVKSCTIVKLSCSGGLVDSQDSRATKLVQCLYIFSSIYAPIVLVCYGLYTYQAPFLFEGNKKLSIWYHTVFSPFVIVAFVIIRNHPTFYLYKYVSTTLAWVGSFSLELFVLQYHLLLVVPNEASLGPAATLQLVPGSPIISAIFASILLVATSHMVSKATPNILKLMNIDTFLSTCSVLKSSSNKGLKRVDLSPTCSVVIHGGAGQSEGGGGSG